ncbi:hypothetical protein G6F70_002868 [Rhizopus microsporus]|nr:hypothetical protein G6F71_002802 [Rhizopus microsporus]KAG1201771.1 hypothetical protein G6F70_002868 [Rhizopus microsporus]KAG1214605.1 hypothetical protein G6F69_001771 [Rhizopus microsporus]KAG1235901.1 hypothetical protein G6F67_002396 [Rhizopus microsporus]KAG1267931.1 hypothetical protein G6F68_001536 [Rhizopus microsporus]
MTKAFEKLVLETQTSLHQLFLKKADKNPNSTVMIQSANIPWSWVAIHVAKMLIEYPTGLTNVVLLAMLEVQWEKAFLRKFKGFDSDFGTIQAVYDSISSETFLLEITVVDWEPIPAANTFRLTVTDDHIRQMDLMMHPKFTFWISNNNFFKNRKLRMICPPKANMPVQDANLPRRTRIALIPPTDLLLIMLTQSDKAFVEGHFTKIKDVHSLSDYNVWLKIIHVEEHKHEGKKKTDVYLADMSSDTLPVILTLFDEQTQLASIFRRNDYMGLYRPQYVNAGPQPMNPSGTVLYYSNDTVIFLMPESEAQAAGLAKTNLSSYIQSQGTVNSSNSTKKEILQRDEEGFIDCSNYIPRIYVSDLVHCMLNVTLLGKVVGLAKNNPFYKDGKRMDRYALRIADTTGTMDITLWEEAGHDSRKLRVGQYVLLEQLATSDIQLSDLQKVWYVNGSVICGTKVYNISTITSLLTSSSFRMPMPLWYAKESKSDHFQIEATIVGWKLHTFINRQKVTHDSNQSQDLDTIPTQYTMCLLPLSSRTLECEFCGYPVNNETIHVFRPRSSDASEDKGWIEWILDDGTSTCHAFGGEEIHMLNDLIGMSVLCSLTDTNSSGCYRIEQVAFVEPTLKECEDLLEKMSK